MPTKHGPFTLPLLQAINDWQRGGDAKQKARRARTLKEQCADLPEQYRQCPLVCTRQIALGQGSVWSLVAETELTEQVSSWSLDLEFVKAFKGGVPPAGQGYQGVIFYRLPKPSEIIINLRTVYEDRSFLRAVDVLRDQVVGYGDGIGRYWDSQSEVVLEIDALTLEDIYSLGGHSSAFELLAQGALTMHLGRQPTLHEFESFLLRAAPVRGQAGPRWLNQDATQAVLARMTPVADLLSVLHKFQSQSA